MLLSAIEAVSRAAPERRAMTWNGRDLSYGQLSASIQAVRAQVLEAGARGPGLALVTLSNLMLAWPWILGLQSLGLTTLSAGSRLAASLDLPPPAIMVGDSDPGDTTVLAPVHVGSVSAASIFSAVPNGGPALEDVGRGGHLMLSSGTTGRPKIVHFDGAAEAATNRLRVTGLRYDETTAIYLAGFPLTSAAGYRSPLRAWAFGGRIVLHQGPDPWAPFRARDLTIGLVTPGMLDELMTDYPDEAAIHPDLTLFVVGGQAHWPTVLAARRRLTPRVYGVYGSTEGGTVGITALEHPDDAQRYDIQEGRMVQVVDESGRPLRPGETGLVRTDLREGVFEYWNDPQTTAQRFRDGWFYPGDLGRLAPDGRLEPMGRADDVLVIGGDKRSAVDLERQITRETGLTGFCLVQRQSPDPDTVHLVYAAQADIDPALAARIGRAMSRHVTLAFHRRDALPMNAMGKVLRIAVRNGLEQPAV